ncbi:TetR family transcriptional regulator [Nonomuraea sp. NPDC026600]|uniref:TetR/AcrR family transcriptional regulator n=1 Tax=Nonomuraea sp. NPDC026600 TaxID=3155363 RepID=UPI0034112804
MKDTTRRRSRRYDPERRARIADAALRVLARDGIESLTHRAVAAEADVQVGSTTYHFASKDELLLAAIESAEERSTAVVEAIFLAERPQDDLASALARFVEVLTTDHREQLILDYEIFLAARRKPALRSAAGRWIEDSFNLMRRFADDATARMLTDHIEGLLVQAVVFDRRLPADGTFPAFQRIVHQ